eukprot:scaffold743_cov117-Cylindrotheca_fusiformis.AAC.5
MQSICVTLSTTSEGWGTSGAFAGTRHRLPSTVSEGSRFHCCQAEVYQRTARTLNYYRNCVKIRCVSRSQLDSPSNSALTAF